MHVARCTLYSGTNGPPHGTHGTACEGPICVEWRMAVKWSATSFTIKRLTLSYREREREPRTQEALARPLNLYSQSQSIAEQLTTPRVTRTCPVRRGLMRGLRVTGARIAWRVASQPPRMRMRGSAGAAEMVARGQQGRGAGGGGAGAELSEMEGGLVMDIM